MAKPARHAARLRVAGLSKSFADRRVFTDISFTVPHRDRIGIIGENGSGKTTLLRVIAGELTPDAGTIDSFSQEQSGLVMGLLHQQPNFPPDSSFAAFPEPL